MQVLASPPVALAYQIHALKRPRFYAYTLRSYTLTQTAISISDSFLFLFSYFIWILLGGGGVVSLLGAFTRLTLLIM